jgi:lipoate-protein ligase A
LRQGLSGNLLLRRFALKYYHRDMKTVWRFIDSGRCDAFYNMALDESLSISVRTGYSSPILRLYGWDRHAVSLGYFQKTSAVDLLYCAGRNIPVVRRPTGGRAVLHGDELTYSFSCRTDTGPFSKGLLDSYEKIGNALCLALGKIGIATETKKRREKGKVLTGSPLCFQSSSYGEILMGGRKMIGAAQKRWEDGMLQQGAIPFVMDEGEMRQIFRIEENADLTGHMTGVCNLVEDLDRDEFKNIVRSSFEEAFGITFLESIPTPEEEALAHDLRIRKYLRKEWNFRQ